jgi:hypothetical protein
MFETRHRIRNALGIVVHDDSHTAHAERVSFGHHTLPEAICNMVGANRAATMILMCKAINNLIFDIFTTTWHILVCWTI